MLVTACGQAAPALTPIPTPTVAPTAVPGTLYVDPSISLGKISPYIFGSNYGPWIAVPADMLQQAYDSGVTVFRFPGGAWGDHNDLKTYQIDQIVDFAKQSGADVTISVRLLNGTPEAAAELVRYANIQQKYGVKYWSIGNEPTLFAGEINVGNYDTVRFNKEWREIAEAMKKVDPSIKLIGPELHQFNYDPAFNPKDVNGKDWMTEFLRANGDLVDVVSFHRYPYPRNNVNATVADLRENSHEWDKTIVYLRDLIHQETKRDLPIAITEVNSHWSKAIGGDGTPDSHYNAIWVADMLADMAKNGVFMVNHWMLTSSGGQGGWGLVGRGEVRPSYYVYQLYKKFGSELVYSSTDDPELTILAAHNADGELTIILINLADDTKTVPLAVNGKTLSSAAGTLFDPTHRAEAIGMVDLSTGKISLPGQSMTLLVLPKN
jgi:hypothetical protein